MGDINQVRYLQPYFDRLEGPFLEVGAKDYGSTQDFRTALATRGEYLGVDMQPGPGVDLVADLTEPLEEIDRRLGGRRFGTIICLSVLEHCAQPFVMAENLTALLKPGGRIYISAPFAWRFHGYPSDYWRFTHEGVRKLFPRIDFDVPPATSTSRPGEIAPLDEELGKIPFKRRPHWQRGHVIRGTTAKSLAALARLGPLRWLAGYDYVLKPTNVLMLGVRRPSS
jgi:hypothetical protein